MTRPRSLVLLFTLATLVFGVPELCEAQVRIGDAIRKARERVNEAKETLTDARALRCDVQGVCGQVTQSNLFAPDNYESLAVTALDGSGRFRTEGALGMVRDAFERRLVENGFLLAASSDAENVRQMIARQESGWSDEELAQLRDFIHGINAVLVVEIRQVDIGQCQVSGGRAASEVTVHMSARWLNPDAGDIPWVATHRATVCEANAATAPTEALETTARQLATTLPVRNRGAN